MVCDVDWTASLFLSWIDWQNRLGNVRVHEECNSDSLTRYSWGFEISMFRVFSHVRCTLYSTQIVWSDGTEIIVDYMGRSRLCMSHTVSVDLYSVKSIILDCPKDYQKHCETEQFFSPAPDVQGTGANSGQVGSAGQSWVRDNLFSFASTTTRHRNTVSVRRIFRNVYI